MGGGGKGGWGGQKPNNNWGGGGVPGLAPSLTEAMAPVVGQEPDIDEIMKKMVQRMHKAAERYIKDERIKTKMPATAAKALVEEFIEFIMGSISGAVGDRPWASEISFIQPLLLVVLHTFEGAKCFNRVLKPQLIKYIEDGIFKFKQEERITEAIANAVSTSGVSEAYHKKTTQGLTKGYDEAHFRAPYGGTTNDSPELALLQDFVKGWMQEFASRAWDVLEHGLPGGEAETRESRISTLSVLFQNLLDPNVACMPAEIATEVTNALGGLPASPWPFIDECANQVYSEVENQNMPYAKRQKIV